MTRNRADVSFLDARDVWHWTSLPLNQGIVVADRYGTYCGNELVAYATGAWRPRRARRYCARCGKARG